MKIAAIVSVVLAVLTTLWTCWPARVDRGDTATEKRKLFNKKDEKVPAEDVGFLQVATWDSEAKEAKIFSVENKDKAWIIPSHYGYPADGGTRVGNTAGLVLNVPVGRLVTTDKSRHQELGVIDPLKPGGDGEGRGKRVTVKSAGGAVVADLIVGERAEQGEVYYVRDAEEENVYTAAINPDISTAFKDWVETDPIKVSREDIRQLDVMDYEVDEANQSVNPKGVTSVRKAKDATEWTSAETPKNKKVNDATVGEILGELTNLRLVGVRPFNPLWLQARGFYEGEGGQRFGSKGALQFTTKDGFLHALFFGALAVGDEEDTGAELKKKDAKDAKKDEKKEKAAGEDKKEQNRYMYILFQYRKEFDEEYQEQSKRLAEEKANLEKEEAKDKTKDEVKKKIDEIKKTVEGLEKKLAGVERKAKETQAKKIARFTRFFYVISDASFQKLKPDLEKLWKSIDVDKNDLPGEKVDKEKALIKKEDDLQYVDLKDGAGDEAEDGDTLEVHYTGWTLDDKKQFDSSAGKAPLTVTLGPTAGVIEGWKKGLLGMKAGGKRKLVIPSKLGYGEAGSPPSIPGNARLVFDVEVVKLTKKKAAQSDVKPEKKEDTKVDAKTDGKAEEKK